MKTHYEKSTLKKLYPTPIRRISIRVDAQYYFPYQLRKRKFPKKDKYY